MLGRLFWWTLGERKGNACLLSNPSHSPWTLAALQLWREAVPVCLPELCLGFDSDWILTTYFNFLKSLLFGSMVHTGASDFKIIPFQ